MWAVGTRKDLSGLRALSYFPSMLTKALLRHGKIFSFYFVLAILSGCDKPATNQSSAGDQPTPAAVTTPRSKPETAEPKLIACALITQDEVAAVQGSPIQETTSSARRDGSFLLSQCFYTAGEFSKSVSVAVTQPEANKPDLNKRTPKDFWNETFARYSGNEEKERENTSKAPVLERHGDEIEKDVAVPPKKISGIGDEAYWTAGPGGALYVLKGNAFIRISLGGSDDEATKIEKSKALASKALARW
jgi:hypothetical protein